MVYENPKVAAWATQKVIKRLGLDDRDTENWHAHDIFRCLRQSYLARLYPQAPDMETMWRWALGYALQEWFLGAEEDSEEFHGILYSTDHRVGDETLEFKTTAKSYEKYQKDGNKYLKDLPKVRFDPAENEGWVTRLRGYCAFRGKSRAHILVFFKHQLRLDAWTFEFTPEELATAVSDADFAKLQLDIAWESQVPPPVTTRVGAFECEHCPFLLNYCIMELRREYGNDATNVQGDEEV